MELIPVLTTSEACLSDTFHADGRALKESVTIVTDAQLQQEVL